MIELETSDTVEAVKVTRVSLDYSARRLERMKALRDNGSIGQSRLAGAQCNCRHLGIAFAQAELNLARCVLLAPGDGVILEEIVDSRTSVVLGAAIGATLPAVHTGIR